MEILIFANAGWGYFFVQFPIFYLSFTSEDTAAIMRPDLPRMRCRSEILSGMIKPRRSRIPLLKSMGTVYSLNIEENDEKLSQTSSGDDNEGKALLRESPSGSQY